MRIASRPLVFAVSLAVFLVLAARFFDYTVDDAFIGFRYARNLVDGHGLVFNPGERVEGYTNFLWVVLIAPFLALSVDAELVARILGLLCGAGALAAVVRFAPRPPAAPEAVWFAPLLLASCPPFAVWTTAGMETPLFTCLVAWSAGLALEGAERNVLRPAAAGLAGVASLTRPEGIGFAVVLAALLLALQRGRPGLARAFGRWWLTFLAVFLPYFVWRWTFYGDPLPNTFYAKVGADPAQVLRGLRYLHRFFAENGYGLVLPLVGLLWSGRTAATVVLGGTSLALLGYVALVGGDGLPMYRFLVPALPLFFLSVALGMAGVVARLGAGRGVRIGAAILVVGLCAGTALRAYRGPSARSVARSRTEVAAWKAVGAWFAANAPPDASIAVLTAGAIPYLSRLEAIDMLGLNDRRIARREMPGLGRGPAGHEKYDTEYVLSRRPTYVVIGVYGLSHERLAPRRYLRPYYAAEVEMLESPEFRRSYAAKRAWTPSGYFPYFARIDETGAAPTPPDRAAGASGSEGPEGDPLSRTAPGLARHGRSSAVSPGPGE
jgi:arabinofuranosyltransferase